MRSPQTTGEILLGSSLTAFPQYASMRLPQNAGEIAVVRVYVVLRVDASMRPPQNAGEICPPSTVRHMAPVGNYCEWSCRIAHDRAVT